MKVMSIYNDSRITDNKNRVSKKVCVCGPRYLTRKSSIWNSTH